MKKFLNSKYGESIILTAISVLNILFTIIFYSLPLKLDTNPSSIWSLSSLQMDNYQIVGLNVCFIIAFLIGCVLLAVSILLVFFKQKSISSMFTPDIAPF